MTGFPEVSEVKCPECGFVSSPPPAACKRCGHRFTVEESRPDAAEQVLSSHILDAPLLPAAGAGFAESVSEMPVNLPGQPWQDEIAERVARYRRRRSRDRNTQDTANSNLEFDFELSRDEPDEEDRQAAQTGPVEDEFDALLRDGVASRAQVPPTLDSVPIESVGFRADATRPWPKPAEATVPRSAPVEIVLGPGPSEEEESETPNDDEALLAASLGRRLAAALVDGLVLLIAACVFTLVFAKTGGEVGPRPSNATIAVLVIAAASLVVFYFALFTALAFATPGQSALGLRVRTLDNQMPDASAAVWRGVGYLVSTAALMLGFIWAVFDSQRLTWHDHMSGTCLALRGEPVSRS